MILELEKFSSINSENGPEGVLVNLYKLILDQSIICAYHGSFSFEVVDKLLKDIKSDLQNREVEKAIAIKTYNILVECLENVYRHSAPPENTSIANEGMFLLSGQKDMLTITIGNLISEEDAENLAPRLESIKDLNKDQLREKYNEIIQNGGISEKGGAGLGLLDIALKANNRMEFQFQPYKNNLIIFIFRITVAKNQ